MGLIRLRLGYSDDLSDPLLSNDRQAIADDLLLKLDNIDALIDNALIDAMADQVGDIKVNYASYLGLLKAQGTLYLEKLATVSGLAVQFNPYTGKSAGQTNPTLMIKSYY